MSTKAINRVRISKIIVEAKDAKSFVLEPLDGWQPQYRPGQFITLVFYTAHGEKRRSYSFSSAPGLNEPMTITVKKVDNGEFSRWLVYEAVEGDILFTSGVSGFFQLPDIPDTVEQYVFLAAGSGITPCFSLIKTLLFTTTSKVLLIFSNRTREDAIFYEMLKDLEDRFPARMHTRFLFSNKFNVYESRLSKWLLLQLLEKHVLADHNKVLFYLCGPQDYMQTITITLLGKAIQAANILKENFSNLPRLVIPRPPDSDPHEVIIHFQHDVHRLIVQYPKSIIAAAKDKGIELPYSCEAGRCGSCAATCISGKIWMAYNEVLMEDEIARGRVLTCQGFPVGGNAEIIF
jgi:ring-1,2-phenylacetyl-CoA epoxidase subunit PaaE